MPSCCPYSVAPLLCMSNQREKSPGFEPRKPLQEVPGESGPIMVIASITMAKQSQFKETQAPISQIAIELYQPLSGGAALGGRFAPSAVKVPDLRDYTPKGKSPPDK